MDDEEKQTKSKESKLFLEDRICNERASGCGGKNVKEIEERRRRRRRKDGEETDRLLQLGLLLSRK